MGSPRMARFGGNGRLCRDDAERGGHYAGQNRKEEAVWLLFEVMSFATEAGERIRRRFRLLISPGVGGFVKSPRFSSFLTPRNGRPLRLSVWGSILENPHWVNNLEYPQYKETNAFST